MYDWFMNTILIYFCIVYTYTVYILSEKENVSMKAKNSVLLFYCLHISSISITDIADIE